MRLLTSLFALLLISFAAAPVLAEESVHPRWKFAPGDEFEFSLTSKLRYDSTTGMGAESRVSELKLSFRFSVNKVDSKGGAIGTVRIVEVAGGEEESGEAFAKVERSYKRDEKALAEFKAEGTMEATGNFALQPRALEPLFGIEDPDVQVARMMLAWPASEKEAKEGWAVPGVRCTRMFPVLEIPGFEMRIEEGKPVAAATGKPLKIDWDGKSARALVPPTESRGTARLETDAATGTTTCTISDQYSWSYEAEGIEGQGVEKCSVKETFESTVTVRRISK